MSIDWNAAAKLVERQDEGSDMYIGFTEVRSGSLADLVRAVAAMPTGERARLVIDGGSQGTFAVGEILGLSKRDDFPAG